MVKERFMASDDAVKTITNEQGKKEVLDFLSLDQWSNAIIKECFVYQLDNAPLFFPMLKEEFTVQVHPNISVTSQGLNNSDEELAQTARDTGLLLVYPKDGKLTVVPTRYTAFSSICARAGINGTTISQMDDKPLVHVLPLIEKAQWLSRGFSLHDGYCQILYRDGKVSAMLSADYVIMPANQIVPLMEERLKKEFEHLEFQGGTFSHEYLVLDYILNAADTEEDLRIKLNEYGLNINTLSSGFRFSTSDIGYSKVTVTPFLIINGVKTYLSSPIAVTHLGKNTPELFIEKLQDLGTLVKESEDIIEALGNMEIKYPAGCFSHIVDDHSVLKSGSEAILESLRLKYPVGKTCTAIDIYIALSSIVDERSKRKDLTPTQLINLCEQISKFVHCKYENYDRPEI